MRVVNRRPKDGTAVSADSEATSRSRASSSSLRLCDVAERPSTIAVLGLAMAVSIKASISARVIYARAKRKTEVAITRASVKGSNVYGVLKGWPALLLPLVASNRDLRNLVMRLSFHD